jgi:hypothetical protein
VRLAQSRIGRDTVHWRVLADGAQMTFSAIVAGWAADMAFRSFWQTSLRNVPFGAYCWECPAVTQATMSRPFECVFVSSPLLARKPPDSGAFAEHFRPGRSVVTFDNLGGDAILVAPCPRGEYGNFVHLAGFTATASAERQDALWQAVGEAMATRVGARAVWLSTAGLGVGWLHVRLDDWPKYYRHAPYAGG